MEVANQHVLALVIQLVMAALVRVLVDVEAIVTRHVDLARLHALVVRHVQQLQLAQ